MVSAQAENWRLSQGDGYNSAFAQAVYRFQELPAAKARAAYDQMEAAEKKGLDAGTIQAALDAKPARFTHTSIARPEMNLPSYVTVLGEPPRLEAGGSAASRRTATSPSFHSPLQNIRPTRSTTASRRTRSIGLTATGA